MNDSRRTDTKPFLKRGISMSDVAKFDQKFSGQSTSDKPNNKTPVSKPSSKNWYDNLNKSK